MKNGGERISEDLEDRGALGEELNVTQYPIAQIFWQK